MNHQLQELGIQEKHVPRGTVIVHHDCGAVHADLREADIDRPVGIARVKALRRLGAEAWFNIGDQDFNLKLSQQRADTVRNQLVERGVAPQRIRTKGYGAKFPVVDNDTTGGRQQNRRVEVVILEEGASAEGSSR